MPSGLFADFVGSRGCRIDVVVQHCEVFFIVKPFLVNRRHHSEAKSVVVGGRPTDHGALLWTELCMESLLDDMNVLGGLRVKRGKESRERYTTGNA